MTTRSLVFSALLACSGSGFSAQAVSPSPPGTMLPPDQVESAAKMHKDLRETGLYEDLDDPAEIDFVMQYLRSGKPGFQEVHVGQADFATFPFVPNMVGDEYLTASSRSYLHPEGGSVRQLHTDSIFGNFFVDEERRVLSTQGIVNVEIAGYPGALAYSKHPGDRWATSLYVSVGDRFYTFQADRKLDASLTLQFLQMAERYLPAN